MQVEIKHLDVASVVKICFVIYAILGIVVGLVYVIFAMIFSSFLDATGAFEATSVLRIAATGFGILLVPLFALLYGIIGAIGGFIFAVVYNLASKALGGIRLTLEGRGTESQVAGLSNQAEVRL